MYMKVVVCIVAFFLLISCERSIENKDTEIDTTKAIDTISKAAESIPMEERAESDTKNDFDILLVSEYRDWENNNPVNKLTTDWFDLYQNEGAYYLSKAAYTIERRYSECTGDSTKSIQSQHETLLLMDYPGLKSGAITSLAVSKNKIWPKEKVTFNFGEDVYTLRGEGDVLSSEKVQADNGEELYQKVENYKLYISKNNSPETLVLEQATFNDTFVELLFIGDIDRDGKADFIFEANRDYEERRVFLYLSSKAEEDRLIKKVSEISIQFDC